MDALIRNLDARGMVYLGHPLGKNDVFVSHPETNLYYPSFAQILKSPIELFHDVFNITMLTRVARDIQCHVL